MTFVLHNDSDYPTEDLRNLVKQYTKGTKYPNFRLIVWNRKADGLTITGVRTPIIIIRFESREQFMLAFMHEFTHLLQHEKGYENEAEVKAEEDKQIPKMVTILKGKVLLIDNSGETTKVLKND